MEIKGYLKTSLIEWPGKISSVIFVPGCNFRCPFCHNRDLVRNKGLQEYSEQSILDDLKKRKKFIDGVVVTGGEPTLQKDLSAFLKKIKKLGFMTMIGTNGSKPEVIKLIVNSKPLIVDYLAMDFKGPVDEYERAIGMMIYDLRFKIEKSLKLILKSGIPFELRTTVVPGIHDEKVLVKMAKQLKKLVTRLPAEASAKAGNPQLTNWFLQTFQPKNCLDPKFNKIKPFGKIEMERFLKAVEKIIPQARLRGE